jgi:hypothetical protein
MCNNKLACAGIIVSLLVLVHVKTVGAASIEIRTDTSDGIAVLNGTPGDHASGENHLVAGVSGDYLYRKSSILFFKLPDIGNSADILSADLRILYLRGDDNNGTQDSADVWGLGYETVAAPVIDHSWYHDSNTDTGAGVNVPSRTKIQDAIISGRGNTPNQWHSTDETGDANLLRFLRYLYDNGATEGNFAIIRINYDSVPSTSPMERYVFASGDAVPIDWAPTLTVEVIPEPATLSLLALGGLMALRRRR